MNKKKTLSKAFKKAGLKSDPFKIVDSKHKKKAKAVKTNIKQIQAKVKTQQESSDKNLESLHAQMVIKKPAAVKQIIKPNTKKAKKAAPNTSKVQDDLKKMNVD